MKGTQIRGELIWIPMRLIMLLLLLFVIAACQSTIYPDNVDHGLRCFERPYADAAGLSIGKRGIVTWEAGLNVYDAPQGNIIARLEAGEPFVVLDGPGCWYVPPTSNNRLEHRVWRVQSGSQAVTGWIEEYGWNLIYSVYYLVEPLADDQVISAASQPLKEPVTFTGHLQWISFEGPLDLRYKTHTLTFDDYGYVQVEVKTDDPGLVNPDVFADEAACRVIVIITPLVPPVDVVGSQMRGAEGELKRLWVQPQSYDFEVSLRFIPGAVEGAAPECPDTDYTLTITPA